MTCYILMVRSRFEIGWTNVSATTNKRIADKELKRLQKLHYGTSTSAAMDVVDTLDWPIRPERSVASKV